MTPITLRVKFKVPQDLLRYTRDSGFLRGVQLFTLIVAVFTWGAALSLFHVLHVKKQSTARSGDVPPIHHLGSEPRPPSRPQLPLQTEALLRRLQPHHQPLAGISAVSVRSPALLVFLCSHRSACDFNCRWKSFKEGEKDWSLI